MFFVKKACHVLQNAGFGLLFDYPLQTVQRNYSSWIKASTFSTQRTEGWTRATSNVLCCEVWRCSHPKPNSVQSCPSPKFQLRASTVHRYIYTIFACLRQFLTSTHFPLLAANLTRPQQWFPNPDLCNHGPLWWTQCPLFFHKLSGISQRAHLTHHFFTSFLGDNWFLSWLAWWTFIFLHIEAFVFSSCQGLHPARLHLMPWLPNSPYFDCRSIICVVSHNTYDYQERIHWCY